jgi:PH domain
VSVRYRTLKISGGRTAFWNNGGRYDIHSALVPSRPTCTSLRLHNSPCGSTTLVIAWEQPPTDEDMAETNGFPPSIYSVDSGTDEEQISHEGPTSSTSPLPRSVNFGATEAEVKTERQYALCVSVSYDSESDSENYELPSETLHFERSPPEQGAANDLVAARYDAPNYDILEQPTIEEEDGDFQILPDDDEAGEDIATPEHLPTRLGLTATPFRVHSPVVGTPPPSPVGSPDGSPPASPKTPPVRIRRFAVPLSPKVARSPTRKLWPGSEAKPDKATPNGVLHRRSSDEFVINKSPLAGPFRAIRARAMAAYKMNAFEASSEVEEWLQDDGSSSDESSQAEDFISSDDESGTFDEILDDDDAVKDFAAIAPLPNSFLALPPDLYDFLDQNLVRTIGEQKLSTFAQEHHLFAKGLMQLLTERDAVGVEDDIHDASNVIKIGPLKKRTTRGLWSVKYVEIRRGNLSYFADDAKRIGSMHRKTVHLRKRTCLCKPVSEVDSDNDIFVFELMVEGRPKIRFMAKSEEERQGWIRAIGQAMIGDVEGSQQNTPVDLSIYKSAIDSYRSVKSALKQVEDRGEYLVAVDSLLYRKTASSALRVPMSWVREEIIEHSERQHDDDSPDARVKSNIAENWKCLSSSSVNINGHLIEQNTSHSANRILGTLARCILEYDRVEAGHGGTHILKRQGVDNSSGMTELEAVSYARSILVSALQSDKHGHIREAVEHLVQNERVAHVEFVKSDHLQIDVSFADEDYLEREQNPCDMSGWLLTSLKNVGAWKNRYFVVSEGVLSFFAEAEPRPYRLRGQIVLNKCTMKTLDDDTLIIENEEEQRCLQFQDRGQLLKWRTVLERAADSESCRAAKPSAGSDRKKGRLGPVGSTANPLKSATDTGVKVGKRAMRVMKEAPKAGLKKARGMLANIRYRGQTSNDDDRRNTTEAMVMMSTRGLPSECGKRDPKVHAVTELNSVYRVMPVPSKGGDDPLL